MSAIESLQTFFDMVGNIDPISKLVTQAGRLWKSSPLPETVQLGQLRRCYPQARTLAMKFPRKYFYVEGYACHEDYLIPVHHAWCSSKNGRVVDNTWRAPERAVYVGVAFKHSVFDEPLPNFLEWGLLRSPEFLKKVLEHPERYIDTAWYRAEDAMGKTRTIDGQAE